MTIVYVENTKESTDKLLEFISQVSYVMDTRSILKKNTHTTEKTTTIFLQVSKKIELENENLKRHTT